MSRSSFGKNLMGSRAPGPSRLNPGASNRGPAPAGPPQSNAGPLPQNVSEQQKYQNTLNALAGITLQPNIALASCVTFANMDPQTQAKPNTRASMYNVGDVILAPHVAPNLNPNSTSADASIAVSKIVGSIVCKYRPMLVVGVLDNMGLYVLPMFTSQGRGIESVPIWKRDDCMPCVGAQDVPADKPGTRRGEVLRSNNNRIWFPKQGCYLAASQVGFIQFAWPIMVLGAVTPQSAQRALKWMDVYIAKSRKPLKDQAAFIQPYNANLIGAQPQANSSNKNNNTNNNGNKNGGGPGPGPAPRPGPGPGPSGWGPKPSAWGGNNPFNKR